MKPCTACGKTKRLSDFPLAPSTKDGRHSQCLACHAAASRAYRATSRGRAVTRAAKARYAERNRARNLAARSLAGV